MYFVYILLSKRFKKLYIGSSASPDKRLASHNAGRVVSTKKYRPYERIFLETHKDRISAEKRERYLKSGWGRRWIKKNLEEWQSGRMRRS
ncbi:MAG: GIY-YIG nuclease family protein [Candidatus Omnitrophota bacterium]|nr:MAG: GIY-YIG nuclease family protein [Candidatus Omnitrophota bacterium]